MTVSNQNFKLYRGDTHTLQVALTQADGATYDATQGAVIRWRLTRNPADEADAFIKKDLQDGGIVATDDGVNVLLDEDDTDLAPGLYYHEMKVWDGTDIDTAMSGYCVVKGGARMGSKYMLTALKGSLGVEGVAAEVTSP